MRSTTTSAPYIEAGDKSPKQRRYTATLLWKNFLIKKKHPIKWALEVLIPVVLIAPMGALKHLTHDVQVPDGWATNDVEHKDDKNGTSYSLFDIQDINGNVPRFYQTEGTMSGCSFSWLPGRGVNEKELPT
ncbi:hypothetical protein AeMF1_007918 [Aphanomyces euteiches]|nr:hypothetical protein AeMF1_007918 [Aphanomyces euteiches]KAH9168884.1 hypothetical protein AeNC1_017833 [Aphanomyces euteiches]